MTERALTLVPTACALGLFLTVGCKPPNAFVPPPPPEVTVISPDRGDVTVWLGFPGRIEARDRIEIRARASGYLREVAFRDGHRVKVGEPLFVIEPEPYLADWEAAKARLAEAEAAAALAQTSFERREQAYETRAISIIDLETAKAQLAAAQAVVQAAQAAVDQAQIHLSYTTNSAPASGRISRRLVSEGNLVGGSEATLLATLVVEDPVHVYFSVSERQAIPILARLQQPDRMEERSPPVRLELADGTSYAHEGRIDYVDNQLDPETGTITARAVFPNPDGSLAPGLYGKVRVPQVRTNAVLVPELALQRDLGGPYLLLVNATNTVEARYVTPGDSVDTRRIITSGLEGNERVIVNGLQRARPGVTVQVAAPVPAGDPAEGDTPER